MKKLRITSKTTLQKMRDEGDAIGLRMPYLGLAVIDALNL